MNNEAIEDADDLDLKNVRFKIIPYDKFMFELNEITHLVPTGTDPDKARPVVSFNDEGVAYVSTDYKTLWCSYEALLLIRCLGKAVNPKKLKPHSTSQLYPLYRSELYHVNPKPHWVDKTKAALVRVKPFKHIIVKPFTKELFLQHQIKSILVPGMYPDEGMEIVSITTKAVKCYMSRYESGNCKVTARGDHGYRCLMDFHYLGKTTTGEIIPLYQATIKPTKDVNHGR